MSESTQVDPPSITTEPPPGNLPSNETEPFHNDSSANDTDPSLTIEIHVATENIDSENFVVDNNEDNSISSQSNSEHENDGENKIMLIPERLKIDRKELIKTYTEIIEKKSLISKKNTLLNRKLHDYFRKKKIFRALLDDNSNQLVELTKKNKNLLEQLEWLIIKEEKTRTDSVNQLTSLNQRVTDMTVSTEKNTNDLNKRLTVIGITLQSSTTGLFLKENEINRFIQRIETTRQIVSEERYAFIQTQDRMTEIDTKAKSLEDLGNGLRMIDFEQLRAEAQSLSDKIEERNNELTKLRTRCYSDTQILAHIREKEFMLSKDIILQKTILKDKVEKLAYVREDVNTIKILRDDLRKENNQKSESCGLLDKPLLMKDYDASNTMIDEQKALINALKDDKQKIEDEMLQITIQMDKNAFYKTESQKFDEYLERELNEMNRPISPWINRTLK